MSNNNYLTILKDIKSPTPSEMYALEWAVKVIEQAVTCLMVRVPIHAQSCTCPLCTFHKLLGNQGLALAIKERDEWKHEVTEAMGLLMQVGNSGVGLVKRVARLLEERDQARLELVNEKETKDAALEEMGVQMAGNRQAWERVRASEKERDEARAEAIEAVEFCKAERAEVERLKGELAIAEESVDGG